MPKWPAGCRERQLNAYRFRWIWTTHPSLQKPDPFLAAVQPEVCCWEGAGSGFAVGRCASQWWCGWAWESPMCAPSHPSRHASHCSPTLLILRLFVLFFIIIFSQNKEVPGGKYGASLLPGCALLGSSGGVAPSPSQAAADTCQEKFSHQGLACQRRWASLELIPFLLGCCQGLEPEPWSWPGVQEGDTLMWLVHGSIHGT